MRFFEKVISPKGTQKNSQKWVWLAGKILVSLPPSFCPMQNNRSANKTQKRTKMSNHQYHKDIHIYIFGYKLVKQRNSNAQYEQTCSQKRHSFHHLAAMMKWLSTVAHLVTVVLSAKMAVWSAMKLKLKGNTNRIWYDLFGNMFVWFVFCFTVLLRACFAC